MVENHLIVEQIPAPFEELPELLRELAATHQLDGYTCRHRLIGQRQALLAKGTAEQLSPVRDLLASYDIDSYLFAPTPLSFAPFQLTRIEADSDKLCFHGREKSLCIPRDARVLILLADLSGHLVERSLSQLLSAHRFRGKTDTNLEQDKQQRIILQGRPVVDIYLLDAEGSPAGAVRALPGKFDHRGLGELATLSGSQNLLKLIELIGNYTDKIRVDLDFGLCALPGATLQSAKENDLDGLKQNLRNLIRYAWLQADIDRQRNRVSNTEQAELTAAAAVTLTALNPELAAALPVVEQISAEITAETQKASERRNKRTPLKELDDLPPPPEIMRHNIWTNPKAIGGIAVAILFGLLTEIDAARRLLGPLLESGLKSGVITGLLALGLYSFAFSRLRLKRLIENTPTSKIRSIAMGMVEVIGTARRQYALVAPMTNISCVYYRLTRYRRNQKDQWVVSSITSSGQVPFWVEDETGRVSIDPSNATVKPSHRQESFEEGAVAFGGFSSSDEKWVEELIYDGAKVYVLGEAQPKRAAGSNRSERRAKALRELKQDKSRLARFDLNGDGKIDEDEWQAARDAVDEELLHADLAASDQRRRQEDQVVIGSPHKKGLPMVIAETASEAHLTRGYGLSTILLLTGAGLSTVLTAWILLQRFG